MGDVRGLPILLAGPEHDARRYVYRLTMGEYVQTGVAATFSVHECLDDRIVKHERTRRVTEGDPTRHITELRAQTGPVLLTYPEVAAIDTLVERVVAGTPPYDMKAVDEVRHTIWAVEDAQTASALGQAFGAVPAFSIADRHHRASSAARADEALGAEPHGSAAFFLAVGEGARTAAGDRGFRLALKTRPRTGRLKTEDSRPRTP